MAWWQTQLVFQGDQLIAETLNDAGLDAIQFSTDPVAAPNSEALTAVIVSGYALYGQVRGYYALGVAQMRVDRASGTGYMSERSQAHLEPVSILSAVQKQVVREWLRAFNPSAWETCTDAFKSSLE
ncbi:MAG: hypothetical protein HY070_13175 [Chloroflexi bacterium]|nr:hypothetical protein [Chloroflexota bacterium]